MNSFTIADLAMITAGLTGAREQVAGSEEISLRGPGKTDRKRFIFKDNRLIGFALVGNVASAGVLTSLVTKAVDVAKIKNQIIGGVYDFASIVPLIKENREKFSEPEYQEVLNFF